MRTCSCSDPGAARSSSSPMAETTGSGCPDNQPLTITLTASTLGALRALVSAQISETESWLRVHRASASVNAFQTARSFADQLYEMRREVERAADDQFDRMVAAATERLRAEAPR